MHTILKITIFSIQLIACKKNSVKPKGMEFYQLEDDSDNNIKDKRCQVFDFTLPKLKSNPLITDEDIYAYDWSIHEITISQSAFAKIKKIRDEKAIIFPLVVTIDGKRIYGLSYKFAILSIGCESSLISESGEGNEPIKGGENLVLINGQGIKLPNNPIIDKRVHDYLKLTKRLVE